MSRLQEYDVDSLDLAQPWLDEPAPAADSSFTNGVNPALIGAGELQGNTTVQDGYLQSANYEAGVSGWQLTPDSADLNLDLSVDSIDIGGADATSFHVDEDGNMWAGASTFASAPAKISNAGAATFSSATITGAVTITSGSGIANLSDAGDLATEDIVTPTLANISLQGWTITCTFSASDNNTVAWGSGTLRTANGTSYSITGSNTGNISSLTYIYLDIAVSTTALQTTTTATTAVGAGKILVACAQNVTSGNCLFQVFGGNAIGSNAKQIVASDIAANTITAAQIAAGTITATQISVSSLSSLSANIGTVTSGTVTGATIQTAASGTRFVMTSSAFQAINSGGTVIFEVVLSGGNAGDVIFGDDASGSYAMWDNSAGTFTVVGSTLEEITTFTASDTLRTSADTTRSTTSTSMVKTKEMRVFYQGTVRVKYEYRTTDGTAGACIVNVYVNGTPVGTEQNISGTTNFQNRTENISVNIGDLVQLYHRTNSAFYGAEVRNFRLYYDFDTSGPSAVVTD